MATVETDKNLLSGVIVIESDLIAMRQVIDACAPWTLRKESIGFRKDAAPRPAASFSVA